MAVPRLPPQPVQLVLTIQFREIEVCIWQCLRLWWRARVATKRSNGKLLNPKVNLDTDTLTTPDKLVYISCLPFWPVEIVFTKH